MELHVNIFWIRSWDSSFRLARRCLQGGIIIRVCVCIYVFRPNYEPFYIRQIQVLPRKVSRHPKILIRFNWQLTFSCSSGNMLCFTTDKQMGYFCDINVVDSRVFRTDEPIMKVGRATDDNWSYRSMEVKLPTFLENHDGSSDQQTDQPTDDDRPTDWVIGKYYL